MKTSNSDGNISSNNSTELSPNRTSRSPTRQKDLNRNRSTSCDSGGGGGQSVKSILKDSITANSKKLKTLFTRSSTVSSPKSSSLRENSLNKKSRPKSVGGVLDDEHVYDEIRGDTPKKKPPRSKKLANVSWVNGRRNVFFLEQLLSWAGFWFPDFLASQADCYFSWVPYWELTLIKVFVNTIYTISVEWNKKHILVVSTCLYY